MWYVRYINTHSFTKALFLFIPILDCSLCSKILWSTVSKAADRSSSKRTTYCLSSIDFRIRSYDRRCGRESGRKSSENRQKRRHQYVQNEKNIWILCSRSCQSNIKIMSFRHRVISSSYLIFQSKTTSTFVSSESLGGLWSLRPETQCPPQM